MPSHQKILARRHIGTAIWAIALLLGAASVSPARAAPTTEPAACDRACLTKVTDQYLAALAARDPSKAPLAANVRITENGIALSTKQGLWASALKNGVARILAVDPVLGQVGYLGTMQETGGEVEVSLRMRVEGGKITEVETIVQRDQRDLILPTLQIVDPLFQGELPKAERRDRDEMARIMRTYFDGIKSSDASAIPLHPAVVRNENGEQKHVKPNPARIPVGDQIELGFGAAVSPRDLRIVAIDELKGIVYVVVMIDYHGGIETVTAKDGRKIDVPKWVQQPFSWMCAEGFAIKNGQIRQLEAVFVKAPYLAQFGWPADGAIAK